MNERFFIFCVFQNSHDRGWILYVFDQMFCNNLQPLHGHPVLILIDFHCFIRSTRPSEAFVINTLVNRLPKLVRVSALSIRCRTGTMYFVIKIQVELDEYDTAYNMGQPINSFS